MIKIEKGVPVPKHRVKNSKYPFATMDIKDSFFVAGPDLLSLRAAVAMQARRLKKVFQVDVEGHGARVWRVK